MLVRSGRHSWASPCTKCCKLKSTPTNHANPGGSVRALPAALPYQRNESWACQQLPNKRAQTGGAQATGALVSARRLASCGRPSGHSPTQRLRSRRQKRRSERTSRQCWACKHATLCMQSCKSGLARSTFMARYSHRYSQQSAAASKRSPSVTWPPRRKRGAAVSKYCPCYRNASGAASRNGLCAAAPMPICRGRGARRQLLPPGNTET